MDDNQPNRGTQVTLAVIVGLAILVMVAMLAMSYFIR